MKVAIISDTHDNTAAIVWIIEYLNKHEILLALHAGDIIAPSSLKRFVQHYRGHLHFVFGNNDGDKASLAVIGEREENVTCHKREMRLELHNRKIYMTHYSATAEDMVHSGLYDVCVGGHDHRFRVHEENGCLFINPGNAVTKDKWQAKPDVEKESTFVVLDLAEMKWEKVVVV